MKWIFLTAAIACVFLVYDQGHEYIFFAAGGVGFAQFALFCLQYEDASNRARFRAEEHMRRLKPGGVDADVLSRLRADKPNVTDADRAIRWDTMTIMNYVSGVASLGFCGYGIFSRMSGAG